MNNMKWVNRHLSHGIIQCLVHVPNKEEPVLSSHQFYTNVSIQLMTMSWSKVLSKCSLGQINFTLGKCLFFCNRLYILNFVILISIKLRNIFQNIRNDFRIGVYCLKILFLKSSFNFILSFFFHQCFLQNWNNLPRFISFLLLVLKHVRWRATEHFMLWLILTHQIILHSLCFLLGMNFLFITTIHNYLVNYFNYILFKKVQSKILCCVDCMKVSLLLIFLSANIMLK